MITLSNGWKLRKRQEECHNKLINSYKNGNKDFLIAANCRFGKTILDPSVGSGNLLIACLAAGADSDKVFGNEFDSAIISTCRYRLNRACDILNKPHIREWQIHQGNALLTDCLINFSPSYDSTILKELLAKRPGLQGNWLTHPEKYKTSSLVDLFGDI